jgi:hypothetical protein
MRPQFTLWFAVMPLDSAVIKPGRYTDIDNEAYHFGPGISKSHLDVVAHSPRLYWAKYIDPNCETVERTPGSAMMAGDL